MNWKKFLITFVVLYVVGSILGMLVHVVWLGPIYEQLADIWRQDMDKYMWVQWVTNAFYCFFFVFIFARGQQNKGVLEGVRFGLIIWGFYSIPSAYGQFMVYPLPYHLVIRWLFADLVFLIILGVLTAVIYKPLPKK